MVNAHSNVVYTIEMNANFIQDRHGWKELQFNGSWVPGVNSGGSGQSLTSGK